MVCNPYIIDDPENTEESASRDIFAVNLIKSIKKFSQNLCIEIQEKKSVAFEKYL